MLVGGERKVYFAVGEEVPSIPAAENVSGYYVLTPKELLAILNP